MTKAKIIGICASVAAAAAITVTVIMLGAEEAYRILKVFEMNGTGNVERQSTVISAYEGMKLENEDTLSVGNESTVRLSLDDNKYILLDQNTVMSFEADGTAENSRTRINLVSGAILNEVTEALSSDSIYEVNTPKATMAVRGTSFHVEVIPEKDGYLTKLSVLHGTVSVQLYDENGNPKGSPVSVTEGLAVAIFTENGMPSADSAKIYGDAYFVFLTDEGYTPVNSGESPLFELDGELISDAIKKQALKSDESGLLQLKIAVADELRGKVSEPEQTTTSEADAPVPETTTITEATTTAATTIVSDTTTTMTTALVTSAEITTVSETTTTSAVTKITKPSVTTTETRKSATSVKTTKTEVSTTAKTTEATTTAVTTAATVSTTVPAPVITGGAIITPPFITSSAVTTTTTAETTISAATTTPETTTSAETTTTTAVTTTTTTATTTTTPEPVKYTVKFVDESGNEIYTEEVEENGIVLSVPEVPVKTGYTGEWNYNGEAVTSDLTITAVYTIDKYTVTYVADCDNAADVPQAETYDYGSTVTLPAVPTKTGYTGTWDYDGSEITGNLTISAVYTINQYTVTYVADCDDLTKVPTAETYDYGSTVTLPAVPTKTGYTGTWDYDGSEITGNLTITAVYVINEYTVTYSAEGIDDLEPMTQKYEYGTVITLMEIPDIEFYTNTSWLCNNTEYASGATVTVESDMDFVVKYTPVTVQLQVMVPYPTKDDQSQPIDIIEISYGLPFSQNNSGLTVAQFFAKYDNLYGFNTISGGTFDNKWNSYKPESAYIAPFDLTDDLIISNDQSDIVTKQSDGTYTANLYILYGYRTMTVTYLLPGDDGTWVEYTKDTTTSDIYYEVLDVPDDFNGYWSLEPDSEWSIGNLYVYENINIYGVLRT